MVLGAVHAGVLAACIVLFVPMGMAGWHLSRNRMLFFSATLFITLAVGVHLMPYFPSLEDIVSSFTLNSPTKLPFPCLSVVNEIDWEEEDTADRNISYSGKIGPTEVNSFPQIGAIGDVLPGKLREVGDKSSPQKRTILSNSSEEIGAIVDNSSPQIGPPRDGSLGAIGAAGANSLTHVGSTVNSAAKIGPIGATYGRTWHWNYQAVSSGCRFQKLIRADALDLLNGSWIVVAGDSEARFVVLSLLELVLGSAEPVREKLFKLHSDYEFVLQERGLKVDFRWAPFAVNLTRVLGDLKRGGINPDVLVMGTGLWHMLYVTNASHYGEGLGRVKNSVMSLLPLSLTDEFGIDAGSTGHAPYMFWMGLPTLVNSMLNTEAKRLRMTREMCASYSEELERSNLLQPAGGPFVLLDMGALSEGCGPSCTDDGMHYRGIVYEAAVQIMLNALLIESRQQPAG
ncbi:hypothetical protein SUGI_0801840 [Cryptomeria japonica]|uniref:protein ALTERED XYLOGLUCAN 9 n=1 Tax=Cryptomeria japonica TaxID=3369 RepID=UPI0024149C51|nr:protein ALTERED XYLOGLUCAN 9 [Cryptomeria japonica]GLJ39293.1 hypothetical protein SUGI_0801840 [Cryptomeria japonica]